MTGPNIGSIKGTIKIDYDAKGISQANDDVKKLGKTSGDTEAAFQSLSRGTGVAALAIAGGFAFAGKTAIDFEKQISAIGAVSGATQTQMEALRQKALQLGSDTAFGASEAALAMEELVKAGLTVDQVLNGAADATVALAAAGGVSLPEAATIASNAMNQFSLSAAELPRVADLIAGAANASAIDVGQFGFSLAQSGAVANLVGLSFDDLALAITAMGKAGIVGSDAGTSLKTMLQNLQPSTAKQRTLMQELGIITEEGANQFFNAQGQIRSMAEVAGVLNTALAGMSDQQKTATLETLFGSDAIRAAATIAGQGATGMNELATAMGAVTAESVAAQRLDNTAGAIEQLKGSAETAAIQIGTALIPTINSLANFLKDAADAFTALDPGTQSTLLKTLVGLAAAFAAVTIAVKAYEVAQKAATLATVIWNGVTKVARALTAAWVVVQNALNLSFFLSPIGLIILAIAALIAIIVLIATKTDWFQRFWNWAWGGIKAAAKAVADWFAGPFADFFVGIWQWLVNTVDNAIEGIKNFFIGLVVAGLTMRQKIIDFLVGLILKWIEFRDSVIQRVRDVIDFIKSLPGRVVEALGNIASTLFNSGKSLMQGFLDGILSMVRTIKDKVSGALGSIRNLFPFSPAKEGPFSGRGWTLYSGEATMEDYAEGIGRAQQDAFNMALGAVSGVASAFTVGPTSPAGTAPASTSTTNNTGLNIGQVTVRGVWDFTDPVGTRRMVAELDSQLQSYQKGYQ